MYLEFIFIRENKKFTSWSLSEVVLGPVLGNQAYPDRRPGLRTQLRGLPAEGHLPPPEPASPHLERGLAQEI